MICPAKVKVAACGRRWGKSESTAIDIDLFALENPNTTQMVLAPTDDQTRIIMDEVRRRLYAIPGFSSCFTDKLSPYPQITFHDSDGLTPPTTIMARTVGDDGKGIRGRKAHRVIVDEAAYVPDAVMQSVVTPLLADFDGDLLLISTPAGRNHFEEAFGRGLDPLQLRYQSFQFPSRDNPFLSRNYLENEQATKPERVWRIEYEAEFADAEGLVFRGVKACATATPQGPLPGHSYTIGVDLGKYNDFTVLTVLDRTTKQVVWIDRFNQIDWTIQKSRIKTLAERYRPCRVLLETNFVGDAVLEDLIAARLNVTGFQTTAASKPDLIDALAVAIEQQKISFPNDPVLVGELMAYAFERTAGGTLRMSAPSGKHDDCVISLALAWYCSPLTSGGVVGGQRLQPQGVR